jgi:hypothetical protein
MPLHDPQAKTGRAIEGRRAGTLSFKILADVWRQSGTTVGDLRNELAVINPATEAHAPTLGTAMTGVEQQVEYSVSDRHSRHRNWSFKRDVPLEREFPVPRFGLHEKAKIVEVHGRQVTGPLFQAVGGQCRTHQVANA